MYFLMQHNVQQLIFKKINNSTTHVERPGNSVAFASEVLENMEEICLQYYMHSEKHSMLKIPTTLVCITNRS